MSTAKYARDAWAQVRKKLLAGNATVHITKKQYELLKAYVSVMASSVSGLLGCGFFDVRDADL